MTHTVTAGIDGSRESLAAAAWAADEAVIRDLPLRLIHVGSDRAGPLTRHIEPEARRRRALGLLDDAAQYVRSGRAGLRAETVLLSGEPVEQLCAAGEDADLLVLGSRGLGSLTGFVTGSVSLAVLAHIRRPVVLVRAQPSQEAAEAVSPGDEVVVGLDLPADGDVLAHAFAHADRHGSGLRVVHSWQLPPLYGPDTTGVINVLMDEIGAEARGGVQEALAPWTEKYPGVAVETRCRHGLAADDLVEASGNAALVVVGLRRRATTWGVHIGPVVHAVVHHTAAPVAIVPHD
ncbi:universal stress protein [Streptomyces zhihengii]|uniref:universal stress protein n=1 Tax=Streptomyces zhihengii TaxID=1818004 RepID=UPI0036B2694F